MFKKNKGHSIKFIVLGVIFLIIGLDFMNNMFTGNTVSYLKEKDEEENRRLEEKEFEKK